MQRNNRTTNNCFHLTNQNVKETKSDKITIFNNLIYQYIDIYQQLEFHRNVSETILAYSTDIPCKYSFANVKTLPVPTTSDPLTHTPETHQKHNIVGKYT